MTANTKRLSTANQNKNLPPSPRPSYYKFCKKSSCTFHKKPNKEQVATKVEESGNYRKINPNLKRSSGKEDTHKKPLCVCSCTQCHYKHKLNKSAVQSSGESDTDKKGITFLKYSWSQTRCNDTSMQKKKKKSKSSSSSSSGDILSVSSRDSVRSVRQENVSNGSFKNKLKVEVPGMECCISSNKVIKSKLSSLCRKAF